MLRKVSYYHCLARLPVPYLSQDLFPDIPYAPFNKADTLGKIADWTAMGRQQQQRAFLLAPPILAHFSQRLASALVRVRLRPSPHGWSALLKKLRRTVATRSLIAAPSPPPRASRSMRLFPTFLPPFLILLSGNSNLVPSSIRMGGLEWVWGELVVVEDESAPWGAASSKLVKDKEVRATTSVVVATRGVVATSAEVEEEEDAMVTGTISAASLPHPVRLPQITPHLLLILSGMRFPT